MAEITIAAVTYNCLDYTKLFLESLKKSTIIPYHLIIVDNHSTDVTPEFLATLPDVELILNKRNLGFGRAHNQAFKRTKTPFYLGLNNDVIVFPGMIDALLSLAKDNPEYSEFG